MPEPPEGPPPLPRLGRDAWLDLALIWPGLALYVLLFADFLSAKIRFAWLGDVVLLGFPPLALGWMLFRIGMRLKTKVPPRDLNADILSPLKALSIPMLLWVALAAMSSYGHMAFLPGAIAHALAFLCALFAARACAKSKPILTEPMLGLAGLAIVSLYIFVAWKSIRYFPEAFRSQFRGLPASEGFMHEVGWASGLLFGIIVWPAEIAILLVAWIACWILLARLRTEATSMPSLSDDGMRG